MVFPAIWVGAKRRTKHTEKVKLKPSGLEAGSYGGFPKIRVTILGSQ